MIFRDVGFLKFYKWYNLPNIMFAVPIFYISIKAISEYIKFDVLRFLTLGILSSNSNPNPSKSDKNDEKVEENEEKDSLGESIKENQNLDNNTFFSNNDILVMIYYWCFLLFYGATSMHVHVSTRFLCSSCPILFLYLGNVFGGYHKNTDNSSNKNFKSFVGFYFLFYGFVGTLLFVNFYPWC